jgi:hypothetical protein
MSYNAELENRHPGLDPGSIFNVHKWIPDQVRIDVWHQ